MLPGARAASRRAGLFAAVLAASVTPTGFARLNGAQAATAPELHIPSGSALGASRARIESSARDAITQLTTWLGPCPAAALTLIEGGTGAGPPAPGVVLVQPRLWAAPRTMEVESQAVFGVARQWFAHVQTDAAGVPVADSIAWYLQSRIVERLFDHPNRAAHSDEAARYFGGFVPRVFESLPLSRWTAGLGREEFLRGASGAGPSSRAARRLPPAMDPRAVRGALAIGTLERYLGWPVLQGILRVVASHAAEGPMDRAAFVRVFGDAAGQDLSWFFDAAFDPAVRFAYGVTAFETASRATPCDGQPCVTTRVTVVRAGNGRFTGSSREPAGDAESGAAMVLRVTYADGQSSTVRWDGRANQRVFVFESPALAVSADLDPEGVLLLDETPIEHKRRMASASNVSLAKWVARWVIWLQDAMLTGGFMVGQTGSR